MRALNETLQTLAENMPAAPAAVGAGPGYDEEDPALARWLVRLRWVAVGAQLICLQAGLQFQLVTPAAVPGYLAVVAGLVVMNLGLYAHSQFGGARFGMALLFGQMVADLAAFGSLLYLAHGCSNPLSSLIFLHAVLGPLILRGVWRALYLGAICLTMTLVCFVSQAAFHDVHGTALPRVASLGAELAVILIIWTLVSWFTGAMRKLRVELFQMQRQHQKLGHLRALGAMAASFSHQFATPLNTAVLRLHRLQRQHPALQDDADLAGAQKALGQCEETVRGLFSEELRIGEARIDDIDLVALVEQVCAQWQLDRPTLPLAVAAHAVPLHCRVPQTVLMRSLLDLLDNAAEAAVHAAVEVVITCRGGRALVSISDDGPGLPRQVREQLGQPFNSSRMGRSGLGLYTAQVVMEAIGGTLSVRDRAKRGTCVTLDFPLLPVAT